MKTNKTPTAKTPRTSPRAAAAKKTPSAIAKTSSSPALLTSPRVTKRSAKTETPLTSPRVTKAAANAKKALCPEVTKSPKPTAAVAKKPKAPAKPKPLPTPAVVSPTHTTTTIEAFIDVGFGNRLTLRGEGAGLSWERGLTMNCLGSAEWVITLEGDADAPLSFKFLLNDERWSVGENYRLAPGKTGAFTPEF